jgi:hypothetical protein
MEVIPCKASLSSLSLHPKVIEKYGHWTLHDLLSIFTDQNAEIIREDFCDGGWPRSPLEISPLEISRFIYHIRTRFTALEQVRKPIKKWLKWISAPKIMQNNISHWTTTETKALITTADYIYACLLCDRYTGDFEASSNIGFLEEQRFLYNVSKLDDDLPLMQERILCTTWLREHRFPPVVIDNLSHWTYEELKYIYNNYPTKFFSHWELSKPERLRLRLYISKLN